jgi:hypothetical protein
MWRGGEGSDTTVRGQLYLSRSTDNTAGCSSSIIAEVSPASTETVESRPQQHWCIAGERSRIQSEQATA